MAATGKSNRIPIKAIALTARIAPTIACKCGKKLNMVSFIAAALDRQLQELPVVVLQLGLVDLGLIESNAATQDKQHANFSSRLAIRHGRLICGGRQCCRRQAEIFLSTTPSGQQDNVPFDVALCNRALHSLFFQT